MMLPIPIASRLSTPAAMARLGAGQMDVKPIVESCHNEIFNFGTIKFESAVMAILKVFIRQVYFRRKVPIDLRTLD